MKYIKMHLLRTALAKRFNFPLKSFFISSIILYSTSLYLTLDEFSLYCKHKDKTDAFI